MDRLPLPTDEIVRITDDLARYRADHQLIDQITVTRGYAELLQLDASNPAYHAKLQIALQRLSEMATQRGLSNVTERIREMGISTATESGISQPSSSLA